MNRAIDERELRRRAVAGVRAECQAFGTASAQAGLIERPGLLACISPRTPDRSLFNAVHYDAPAALAARLDELAARYEGAGVRAWTVWVPDDDRASAELLAARGHRLDAAPRAMAIVLDELGPAPAGPTGLACGDGGDPATAAALNDRAYGYEGGPFAVAIERQSRPPIEWWLARRGQEAICCVGAIALDDDVCLIGVATPAEHRGAGVASWLLHRVLTAARRRGARTASLQATKAGTPIYARLGFRDFGSIEMWERRRTV